MLFNLSKRLVFHLVMCFMLVYFVLHAFYGKRGAIAYANLRTELIDSHIKLTELRATRLKIENNVKLLHPDSLDRDMLDERTRDILGVSNPSEQIFKPN